MGLAARPRFDYSTPYNPDGTDPTRGPSRQSDLDTYNADYAPYTPDQFQPTTNDGKIAAVQGPRRPGSVPNQLGRANQLRDQMGYGKGEDALYGYESGRLDKLNQGESLVDTRHPGDEENASLKGYTNARLGGDPMTAINDVPTLARLSTYARDRLGTGLTPEEMQAYRGGAIDSLEGGIAADRQQAAATAVRGSYGDPRLAAVTNARIGNAEAAGRAGIGRDLIAKDLERKGQIESLAATVGDQEARRRAQVENLGSDVASREEQSREFDVGANEAARRGVESGMGGLASMEESRRQYDVGLANAIKQAKLSRKAYKDALYAAQPGSSEKAMGYVNAVLSGLGG